MYFELCESLLASFPGSPRVWTKNWKERGKPGEIYHVRNVIGRENLITSGQTNELAHAVWTGTVVQLQYLLYGWQNGTRRHYATLPGGMKSYSERTQTGTFENHVNLIAYLANWPLFIPENGFQGSPFLGFAEVFSALLLFEITARTDSY